jgi:hypothetical protein
MATKHPMSFNSSCFIEFHSSHRLFVFIMHNHWPSFHPISHVNHAPPINSPFDSNKPHTHISSPYWPPILCVNMEPWPYIFSNPFDHAHLEPFPLPLYWPFQLPIIKPPNLFIFPQHVCNFHLKFLAPHVGANLLVEGLLFISVLINHPFHLIQTLVTILTQYPSLFPPHLHKIRLGVSSLDVLRSFHLGFCRPWLYNYNPSRFTMWCTSGISFSIG